MRLRHSLPDEYASPPDNGTFPNQLVTTLESPKHTTGGNRAKTSDTMHLLHVKNRVYTVPGGNLWLVLQHQNHQCSRSGEHRVEFPPFVRSPMTQPGFSDATQVKISDFGACVVLGQDKDPLDEEEPRSSRELSNVSETSYASRDDFSVATDQSRGQVGNR